MRRGILVFIGWLFVNTLFAQIDGGLRIQRDTTKRILGDTIKASYTALTTKFTYQKYIKENDLRFFHPDTIPDNFHRFTDLERNDNFIQNLGNIGTAINPLFFQPKMLVGRSSGYHSFDQFYTTPDQIKYYDTRSPYSNVTASFGGGGRARTDLTFAINDSTRLNFGFGYRSIRADKQLAFSQRGDRNVQGADWNVFAYIRPDRLKKYQLLLNLTQFKHEVTESGGIIPPEVDPTANPDNPDSSLFLYQDANVILSEATSLEKRGGLHIYHQLELDSAFQLYHEADYYEQLTRYSDIYNLGTIDSLIYSNTTEQTIDTLSNRTTFREFKNEFGMKGRTSKFAYSAFYRYRRISYDNAQRGSIIKETEHYLGGTLRQQISSKIFLSAKGEFLLDGNYAIKGDFSSDLFDATFQRVESKPSYLADFYSGQQTAWEDNGFKNEVSDNITGQVKLKLGKLSFRPTLQFNRISNHVYFDENKLAAQAGSDIVLLVPGFHLDWDISERWSWKNTLKYTSISGGSSEVYRVPEIMTNSQIAYKNILFNGKMILHTGIAVHHRSAYTPYNYNPINQQFFLQNTIEADSFIKADLFLNFKVQNFNLFLKLANANQGITYDGYFLAPYYTGGKMTIDLGLKWSFFD